MELHKNTTEAFINYLRTHGYPLESIVLEWGNPQAALDIVIVAEDKRTPIAAYEIKGTKNEAMIVSSIKQVARVCKRLNLTIPVSIVYAKQESPFFEVVDVSNYVYGQEPVNVKEIMRGTPLNKPISYRNIEAGSFAKRVQEKSEKQKKRFDQLKLICWLIVPVIALILLYWDKQKIFILNTNRLIILGTVLIVVFIPFFSEITLGEIKLKREQKREKDNE